MNQRIKAAWLEALRSGKYQQGIKYLRTADDKYCCLGVLCDISGKGDWLPTKYDLSRPYMKEYWLGQPPSDVIDEADLTIIHCDQLAAMNDSGKTFEEIAQYIEKNL